MLNRINSTKKTKSFQPKTTLGDEETENEFQLIREVQASSGALEP